MSLLYRILYRCWGSKLKPLCLYRKTLPSELSQSLLEDFFFISKTHSCQFPDSSQDLRSVLLVYALLQSGKNHIPEPVRKGGFEASWRQLQTVFIVIAVYYFLNFVSFLFLKKNSLKIELHYFPSSQVFSPQPLPCLIQKLIASFSLIIVIYNMYIIYINI